MERTCACLALALLLAIGAPRGLAAERDSRADPAAFDRFAPETAPVPSETERERLEAGGVVIRDLAPSGGVGIAALVMGLVEAAPDRVWQVVSDCEEQDEFLPRVSYSAVRDRDGDAHTCELVVDLPFPMGKVHTATRHHVRQLPDGGYQRRWELLPGDWSYRRDHGSWSVHPYAGGRSLLVNRIDLLPRTVVPEWIVRSAYTLHAPQTFDAIRVRVREKRALHR